MEARSYASGEFARMAGVTVRTLRYYDRIGLLTPTDRTDAGYRLYSDEDLEELEQILALKYLGFSLDEIRRLAVRDVSSLEARLAKQKAMVRDKRTQLDDILRAIERAEEALRTKDAGTETLAKIIEVIQMEQKDDWLKKYFTDEQRETMDRLSERSYSEGAEPSSDAGQAAAKTQIDLIRAFTQGDPEVEQDLQTWWNEFAELPADQKPPMVPWGEDEAAFLAKAMAIYREQNE